MKRNMKNLIFLSVLAASVSACAAVNDLVLTFSSTGPDRYQDGTQVLDGECYALVWLPSGSTGFALAGTANGRAKAVNAVGQIAGASVRTAAKAETAPVTVAGAGETVASTVSALPKDVPQPEIKSIRVEGGLVYVTVANTVPYLQYNLAAGTDPANLNEAQAAKNPVNGQADGDIILVTPAKAGGGFFRVQRN